MDCTPDAIRSRDGRSQPCDLSLLGSRRRQRAAAASYLLFAIILAIPILVTPSAAAAVQVIVNSDVQQQDLPQTALGALFGMRKTRWPNGKPVKVFVFGDSSAAHGDFCKTVLNVYPHQLRRLWNRLVFSGTGQAPIEVDSAEAMLRAVAETPGAIGYLDKQLLQSKAEQVIAVDIAP
ncbi:hypothetical protein Thiowin_00825 [Thiorhodovibrio winogradskyi]|uniref:PBP domain-containing protein n=2 Tax=Thiorhodovibrio winogradskyi TaxID=77007 RepID=A0ABZ0S6W6_9GAMM